jgi:acetylornithine deacetylase
MEGTFGSTQRPENVHAANPIELMGRLIQQLRDFERDLPCDPGWTAKVVAITDIRSQGWFSNVPEECTASGFANVLPPLSRAEFKTRFETFVQQAAKENSWLSSHPPVISWGPLELDSLVTSEQSEFLQILSDAHRKNFDTSLQRRKLGGWADAQMLGIPHTVLYGPGAGGGDHSYDEYYELATLAPMLKTLVQVVVDWCGRAGAHR